MALTVTQLQSQLSAALNIGDYNQVAATGGLLQAANSVQSGSIENVDLTAGAITAASAPAIGVSVMLGDA